MSYSVEDLVPYRGPMKLLDRVVSHDDEGTVCEFTVPADSPLLDGEDVRKSLRVEYMGQCSFVRNRIIQEESAGEESFQQGVFVSARNVTFSDEPVRGGETYRVEARDYLRDADIVSCLCSIYKPDAPDRDFVSGRLTAILTNDLNDLEALAHE